MSVVVEFAIDSDQFVLGRVLALDPDTHVTGWPRRTRRS